MSEKSDIRNWPNVHELERQLAETKAELEKAKAQINAMRCCDNCANYYVGDLSMSCRGCRGESNWTPKGAV